MKKIAAILMAALLLLSLAACGAKSVVGKWAFGVNTFEFKEDNTVSISVNGTLNYDGTYTVDGEKITVTAKGMMGETTEEFTYSLKGDTLTLTGDITLMGSADVTLDLKRQ